MSLIFSVAMLLNANEPDEPLPPHALLRLSSTHYCSPDSILWCLRSADGKFFLVQSSESLLIIDAATGRRLRETHVPNPLEFGSAVLTPDNKHILRARGAGVDVLKVDSLELERVSKPDKELQGRVSLSADGKLAAVCRSNEVNTLRVSDRKTLLVTKLNQSAQTYASLSGDGGLLAVWGRREENTDQEIARQVEIWEVESGKLRFKVSKADGIPSKVLFSPDRARIAAFGSRILQIWDVKNGVMIRRIEADFANDAKLCFSVDGKKVAFAYSDKRAAVYDVSSGKLIERSVMPLATVDGIACGNDGVFRAWGHVGNVVAEWDILTGKSLNPIGEHSAGVSDLRLSADGKKLYTAGFDSSRVLTWDAFTGAGPRQLKMESDMAGYEPIVIFGVGAESIALVDPKGEALSVHKGSDGAKRFGCDITEKHLDRHTLFFSPDGEKVTFASGFDRSLSIRNVHSGKVVRILSGLVPGCGWRSGAFSADGKLLALANSSPGASSDIAVLSVDANKTIATAELHTIAQSLLFLDERRLLAMGWRGGRLYHYDARTGKPLRDFEETPDAILTGKLALSRDGRLVAAGIRANDDGQRRFSPRVLVWEAASGRIRHVFEGHSGQIEALAFSPDGYRLASGASDTTVLLWDLRGVPEKSSKSTAELWTELDLLDARSAEAAIRILASRPEATMALCKENLRPAPQPDNDLIRKLLADLQADRFVVRAAAAKQLEKIGAAALPALEAALRAKPNVDFAEHLEKLRATFSSIDPDEVTWRQDLRPLRALEALERIGSMQAREVVQMMAGGADGAKRTRAARLALGRWK